MRNQLESGAETLAKQWGLHRPLIHPVKLQIPPARPASFIRKLDQNSLVKIVMSELRISAIDTCCVRCEKVFLRAKPGERFLVIMSRDGVRCAEACGDFKQWEEDNAFHREWLRMKCEETARHEQEKPVH